MFRRVQGLQLWLWAEKWRRLSEPYSLAQMHPGSLLKMGMYTTKYSFHVAMWGLVITSVIASNAADSDKQSNLMLLSFAYESVQGGFIYLVLIMYVWLQFPPPPFGI